MRQWQTGPERTRIPVSALSLPLVVVVILFGLQAAHSQHMHSLHLDTGGRRVLSSLASTSRFPLPLRGPSPIAASGSRPFEFVLLSVFSLQLALSQLGHYFHRTHKSASILSIRTRCYSNSQKSTLLTLCQHERMLSLALYQYVIFSLKWTTN